jgi:undecaprenyl-diphosphatase
MALPSLLVATALPMILFLALWALIHGPLIHLVHAVKAGARGVSGWISRSAAGIWLGSHSGPFGRYAPILLIVAGGGLTALGAGYLFVELAEHLRRDTSTVNAVDQAVHAWFGQVRQPARTALLGSVTQFGGTIALAAIVAGVAAILVARKERATAVFLIATTGIGALLNLGLKMIFERERPDLSSAISVARWFSFPSGHAMGSFITFGALAYIALRQPWSWGRASACLAAAQTVVLLVGLSRVYLGVHWVSDIAGAWSAGAVWLVTAVVAFEMLLRLHRGAGPR